MAHGDSTTTAKLRLFEDNPASQAYGKLALFGMAAAGKTYTGSLIAIGLHQLLKERGLPEGDSPVLFLDTETGSHFVKPMFDKAGVPLKVARTRAFVDLLTGVREAAANRCLLVIDSITHFWVELCDTYAEKKGRTQGLQFHDWAWLKGPKAWGRFSEAFINAPCHIIMCGRAKFEYAYFEQEGGKKELEKTGVRMKSETETAYEPNLLILMEREQDLNSTPKRIYRNATVLKDRSGLLDGRMFRDPTFEDFLPHFDSLCLGGDQRGVDPSRTSADMIEKEDATWRREREMKEIRLDEIKAELLRVYPGQSTDEKNRKAEMLERHFGTRSWKRVESYSLDQLDHGFAALCGETRNQKEPETCPTSASNSQETTESSSSA